MRLRDIEQKDFLTGLEGESSGRFYMENLEMSSGAWDKMTQEMRQISRVQAGWTDGLGSPVWVPGPSSTSVFLSHQAEACGSPP